MLKRLIGAMVGFALLLGSAGFVATGSAAGGPGAAKLDLVGPGAVIFCNAGDPYPEDVADETLRGFVIFNQDIDEDLVKATVSIKGGEPHTDYPVRLIQNAFDCNTIDAVATTNGQGKATVHIEEPVVNATVQVIVDSNSLFENPTYRATELYELS